LQSRNVLVWGFGDSRVKETGPVLSTVGSYKQLLPVEEVGAHHSNDLHQAVLRL